MKASFAHINKSPAFVVEGNHPNLSRIFGGTYIKKSNVWVYPAYPPFLDNVLADFSTLQVPLDDSARAHCESITPFHELVETLQSTPPLGPHTNYEHQFPGVAELVYYHRWALRWGMGTGKTKVVIEALNYLKGKKALIIAPTVALDNWLQELETHSAGSIRALSLVAASKKKKLEILSRAIEEDFQVLVTTYDTARIYGTISIPAAVEKVIKKNPTPVTAHMRNILQGLSEADALEILNDYYQVTSMAKIKEKVKGFTKDLSLEDFPYEILVLDESHRVKNIWSKRTKTILNLAKRAPRRYLLTGTISMGNPLDLYPQMNVLAKYLCPEDYVTFKKKFCTLSPYDEHIVTGYKNLNIINHRINSISSEKRIDDCIDLPELTDVDIHYDLSLEQKKDHNSLVQGFELDFGEYGSLHKLNGGVKLNKLLQVCSGFLYVTNKVAEEVCNDCPHVISCVVTDIQPTTKKCLRYEEFKHLEKRHTLRYPTNPKLKALQDLLSDLLSDPCEKVVIWATFETELDDIQNLLKEEGIQHVRVDGSTTSNIKNLAEEFNTNPDCRVYIGQISTGIAINLVSARYAVYYSRSWSLEHWLQSRAREYRIGQTRKTVVYRLCAPDSIEAQQLLALDNREDIAQLLTQKVDCLVCTNYSECLAQKIVPWSSRCVYQSKVVRTKTKAKELAL